MEILVACLVIYVPLAGLLFLGARRERIRIQRIVTEHANRMDKFQFIRGGRV